MKWYQDTLQAVQTPIPNFIVMISPFMMSMINSSIERISVVFAGLFFADQAPFTKNRAYMANSNCSM